MIAFIFLLIIGIIGLGALSIGIFIKDAPGRGVWAGAGIVVILFSFFTIFLGQMMQTVPAQDIGIELSGGAPSGHINPGYSFIAPWKTVVLMDNAVQRVDYNVADPSSGTCDILIRIANQQTACAKVQLRMQPQSAAVDQEFRQYGSTAGIISGLVTPSVQKYANQEFQSFDPIADVDSTAALGSPTRPTTEQFAERIQADLQAAIGNQVKIDQLSIPTIQYDSTVQAQLNAAFTQKAKTVIAQQSVQTAMAQAAANAQLQKSLQSNPLALVQQCMTGLINKDIVPVAGFSCWPAANSGIVIPAA